MADEHDRGSLDRRTFLKHAALGSAALLTGCAEPVDEDPPRTTSAADMSDTMHMDEGMPPAGEDMAEDMAPPGPLAVVSKPAFVHFTAATTAKLRVETRTPEALEVRLERRGASGQEFLATTDTRELAYVWPGAPGFVRQLDWPDEAGDHTLQDVVFEDLVPGETYDWVIHLGNGEESRGSFRAPPEPGTPCSIGWLSDTMFPKVEEVVPHLAAITPDLILHGGDFQYMSNPLDTWNGMFHRMVPLTSKAAFHIAIGNHEYEEFDEFNVQYRRLFDGQGVGGTLDYYAIPFAGWRILMLNSEMEFDTPNSPQITWLMQQLEQVKGTEERVIVGFHRPFFTFAKNPRYNVRDLLHPILRDGGVELVLTGHHHCYERFEVEGMTYVVDGGGGALLYDPDGALEDVLATRPEDEPLRKVASRTNGSLSMDLAGDGTMTLTRVDRTGAITDTFSIG